MEGIREPDIVVAAREGRFNDIYILCTRFAEYVNVDAQDRYGNTTLMYVVMKNYLGMVQYLIGQHANVNAKDKFGRTSLMFAAVGGNQKIIETLIDKGAYVNTKDKFGRTALMFAARSGNLRAMRTLIDKGAEVNEKNQFGRTALMYAARSGNLRAMQTLIDKGANVNATDKFGYTVLNSAIWGRDQKTVQYLIDNGVEVNAKDNYDNYLLKDVKSGKVSSQKAAQYLIKRDVEEVNAVVDKYGKTELMRAVENRNMKTVQYLINNGANVNLKDKFGRTVLNYAIWERDQETVQTLIDNGANVNATDKFGRTVLNYAIWEGDQETVQTLIDKYHAKVNVKDNDGNGLLERVENGEVSSRAAAQFLIDRDAEVNAVVDEYGTTELMRAVENRNMKTVQYLINSGANVNATDKFGRTSLMFAAEGGNQKIIETLIDNGADVYATDNDGCTAEMYAIDSWNQKKNVIDSYGIEANPTVVNLYDAMEKCARRDLDALENVNCKYQVQGNRAGGINGLIGVHLEGHQGGANQRHDGNGLELLGCDSTARLATAFPGAGNQGNRRDNGNGVGNP